MTRAVILLSGGLDSATVLAIAKSEGRECHALSIVYGQRHVVELEAARRVVGGDGGWMSMWCIRWICACSGRVR